MDVFVESIAKILIIIGLLAVGICLGTVCGAGAGWLIGQIFSATILKVLAKFHIDISNLEMWELGAMLGFIGGFFRTSSK